MSTLHKKCLDSESRQPRRSQGGQPTWTKKGQGANHETFPHYVGHFHLMSTSLATRCVPLMDCGVKIGLGYVVPRLIVHVAWNPY